MAVRPLLQEWGFSLDTNGSNGIRVYIDCAEDHTEATTLPALGDSWDATYYNCTVKKIDTRFLCERSSSIKKYSVSYDSYVNAEASYSDTGTNAELLPISIELASDYFTFANQQNDTNADFWAWADTPTERLTGQTLFKLCPMETFVITRYIWGDNLEEYNTNAKLAVGKVNMLEFLGFDPETVRFDGAQIEEVKNNRSSRRKWLARLKFTVKLGEDDTWQKLYDYKTNTFKEVIFGEDTDQKMYSTYDLATLFRFGEAPLTEDPVFPNQ